MTATSVDGPPQTWQARVAAKRAKSVAGIPAAWKLAPAFQRSLNANATSGTNLIELGAVRQSGVLSEKEIGITETPTAGALLQQLRRGELAAEDVVVAFCKRAAVAQQLTSCLTETFFDEAIERAHFLDEYLKKEKRPIGPLHGLPISVKDSFCVKGHATTLGFVSFLDNPPASQNSALVQILLDLGAVLYVKTNIPQTLMTADSDNNVFGRTLNPHNTSLTAGGSSGGEGALVALRGSILGVGTDVAGSIRIPSLCCGVYGFKPTPNRIPYGGQVSPALLGDPGIPPAAGPLGQSVADLQIFFKSVLDAVPWKYDSTASAVPWLGHSMDALANSDKELLTVGVLAEDPDFPLHPPVRRAFAAATAALAKAGHKIVQLPQDTLSSPSTACRIAFELFSIDPLQTTAGYIKRSGEPFVKSVLGSMPPGEPKNYSIDMLAALNVERTAFGEKWRQIWVENGLDLVLSPGAQNTAVPHDTYGLPPYTALWNLLDYPACIIPYGKSSKETDPQPVKVEAPAKGPDYDPDAVHGAPCAIQISTPPFHDEKCLAVADIVDQVLNGRN
ncbi:uncharacterized protein K452DRAFT_244341 [Aplosporella prunicola CBS 121167]|uniref:amidase n=1 Tax=Aplosporella prunicola CBS 121167 TaxID=1176127 RepID=A0A6A6BL97_9PEZI|nr:uncharacterized protein K452DRAFT_244341 [Aplosporella prunicola CBS 121167]KAF2144892.1 hypothetical protein K452DRAFT_244341 [Aplosporella prunicola CBS 121167]